MAEQKVPQLTSSHKHTKITTIHKMTQRTIDQNHLPWPGKIITACMSCLPAGGPNKEHSAATAKTNCETSVDAKRREEMPAHNIPWQIPRNRLAGIHLGLENCVPPGRALSQIKYGHQWDDWPETNRKANRIPIKPETSSSISEQFSSDPLPSCSPMVRLPCKVFSFVSTCVSLDN